MYKAIIADDEETVRRGLVTHFNWGKHGVHVAGVFDDGAPALEIPLPAATWERAESEAAYWVATNHPEMYGRIRFEQVAAD